MRLKKVIFMIVALPLGGCLCLLLWSVWPTSSTPTPVPTVQQVAVEIQPLAATSAPQPTIPPSFPTPVCGQPVAFPRPSGDNGRGIHWCASTRHRKDVTDRLVPELRAMGIKWALVLEGIDSWDFAPEFQAEDAYLIKRLQVEGIMPIVRINGRVGDGNRSAFEKKVRELRGLGVRYFQIFNEPNISMEWENSGPPTVEAYVSYWLPRARMVVAAGGLPGLGSLDPAGGQDDMAFLVASLETLKRRGECEVLTYTWIGVHNYALGQFNNTYDYVHDPDGFALFTSYDRAVRQVMGFSLPIIATEGGIPSTRAADWQQDPRGMEELQARWLRAAFDYLPNRPDYFHAFCPWILGNLVCDSQGDPAWEFGAFFDKDGNPRPVVKALRAQ